MMTRGIFFFFVDGSIKDRNIVFAFVVIFTFFFVDGSFKDRSIVFAFVVSFDFHFIIEFVFVFAPPELFGGHVDTFSLSVVVSDKESTACIITVTFVYGAGIKNLSSFQYIATWDPILNFL